MPPKLLIWLNMFVYLSYTMQKKYVPHCFATDNCYVYLTNGASKMGRNFIKTIPSWKWG